ncbi:MAG: hypothetical protein GX555_07245 [Actinomycetales bacterium]|nr:hypothetical protein [Actinomycetales bacterium]
MTSTVPWKVLIAGVTGTVLLSGCTGETPAEERASTTPPSDGEASGEGTSDGVEAAPGESTGPDPTEPVAARAAGPERSGISREDQLAALWQESGLGGEALEVELVREVDDQEWGTVHAECLTAAGFPPEVSGGSVTAVVPEGQEEEHALADYTCRAQYPRALEHEQPLTRQQLAQVHAWFLAETIPCYTEHGHVVDDVPTLEEFVNDYRGPGSMWLPEYAVKGDPVPAELDETCPRFPPDDVLFGG